MSVIEDDDDRRSNSKRSNLKIKEHHEGGWARILDQGVRGQTLKKGGVWWDRPKTIGRLGDIGFFTL